MLQILNSTERNQAFLKFLLFFLITVSLIVTAVYFNFKMPRKENALLKSEVNNNRIKEANQFAFLEEVEKAVQLIDSLEKPNTNYNQIDLLLDEKMNTLTGLSKSVNPTHQKLNERLVQQLNAVKNLKKEKRTLEPDASQARSLRSELEQCQQSLSQARASLSNTE